MGVWGGLSPTTQPLLPLEKTRYPLYRRLCGPQDQSGRAENLVPTGIRSWTVQPVVRVAILTELPSPHIIPKVNNNSQGERCPKCTGELAELQIPLSIIPYASLF